MEYDDYDDVEFVEGVHKSVRRAPLHKIETDDEQAAEPSKEPRDENELAPLPENVPEPQRARSGYRRWFQIVAVLLLICIVGGGVLIFLKLRTAPQTQTAHAAPKHGAFCTTSGAVVNINEGSPSLDGVAALSQKDVWAVGNLANQTLTEHWDGTHWLLVPSPNGRINAAVTLQNFQASSHFNSVSAISTDDVWAVGSVGLAAASYSTQSTDVHTLIEHWNGSQWSIVPSPDGTQFQLVSTSNSAGIVLRGRNELQGVAAVSANDIWAVGSTNASSFGIYNGYDNSQATPLIEHWDGDRWSVTPTPNLPPNAVLSSITALAPDDVWAVGTTIQAKSANALIAHWDGQQWSVVSNASTVQGGDLGSISASSANDIWATGFGLIVHWDGTSWSRVSYPTSTTKGAYTMFRSVVALSANNVWLAGAQTNPSSNNSGLSSGEPVLEHWDGQQWKSVVPAQAVNGDLDSIASADGRIWAVGTSVVGLQEIQNPLIETNC